MALIITSLSVLFIIGISYFISSPKGTFNSKVALIGLGMMVIKILYILISVRNLFLTKI